MLPRDLHEDNRRSWNAATRAHNSHKGDQAAFLKNGGSTLFPEEVELLGDLHGLSLVHLQCNAGQDTLSLAARGARVTGVDISDEAIAFAQALSAGSGLPGTFVRADVYDWLAGAPAGAFDVAFCSYGAICWLSDLPQWARGIAGTLRPGGRFVTVEFHPVGMMFDEKLVLKFPGAGGQPFTWKEGIADYVAMSKDGLVARGLGPYEEGEKDFKNPHCSHEFPWAVSEVIQALVDAGLRLEVFREYLHSNGFKIYDGMTVEGASWKLPHDGPPSPPLMYGLVARKP